jgi:hypothetical protein
MQSQLRRAAAHMPGRACRHQAKTLVDRINPSLPAVKKMLLCCSQLNPPGNSLAAGATHQLVPAAASNLIVLLTQCKG